MFKNKIQTEAFNTIRQFNQYRPEIINSYKIKEDGLSRPPYLVQLLNLKISYASIFQDHIWDFNKENPNVPPDVKGSKLKVDFNKYKIIPEPILIEIKCLTLFILITPEVFFNNRKKVRKKTTKTLATNTVLSHIKSGLRFLDRLFNILKEDLGKEHVENSYGSLTQITEYDYRNTASKYTNKYNDDLRQFLSYLQNPHTSEYIIGDSLPPFDPDQFEWKNTYQKKVSNNVIPNSIFEKLVRTASLLVHDFLATLEEEVLDNTVKKYSSQKDSNYCKNAGVTEKTFKIYRAFRLLNSGYSEVFVARNYGIPTELRNSKGKFNFKDMSSFISKNRSRDFHLAKIFKHLSLVGNAARYLLGQYTGMRPSELSILRLDNCLVEEQGIVLLQGHVFKGTDNLLGGLFDDKWAVIPIMQDAIKALEIISTITQRKLIFSSINTLKENQAESSSPSASISYHIKVFIKFVAPNDNLEFNNYMMRHTLAYQLYRLEAGLPLISFQLKHLVNTVDKFLSRGATSDITMGYGGIADCLVESQAGQKLRKQSEIEVIKATADPDGNYLGGKAKEHKERLQNVFKGYMASGYSKEEIFEAMAEQGLGVINVGLGYCYGSDHNDKELPCIGSLRCNPIRCSNAIVSEANAPYWREVYSTNLANLSNSLHQDNFEQIKEVVNEAKSVLELLGHKVDDDEQ